MIPVKRSDKQKRRGNDQQHFQNFFHIPQITIQTKEKQPYIFEKMIFCSFFT